MIPTTRRHELARASGRTNRHALITADVHQAISFLARDASQISFRQLSYPGVVPLYFHNPLQGSRNARNKILPIIQFIRSCFLQRSPGLQRKPPDQWSARKNGFHFQSGNRGRSSTPCFQPTLFLVSISSPTTSGQRRRNAGLVAIQAERRVLAM
jgi:hypothetical protein